MTTAAPDARRERLLALAAPLRLRTPWTVVTVVALVVAAVWTAIWQGAPTYDPWAWIIWGREIVQGDLVTTTGPSWKPLPMLFTIPFGLTGDLAPDLWLWVARATALLGIVVIAVLAARLGGRLAAAFAAIALAANPLYFSYGVQGSSEGMLVGACGLAALAWLDDRRSAAFWWLVVAALLRPEAWPFLALLGLERMVRRPQRSWWVVGSGLLVLATWLVPEKIGSGAWLRAAERANKPNPDSAAFAAHPSLEVLGSMGNLLLWAPAIALVLTVVAAVGLLRRSGRDPERRAVREAGLLALLALIWVVIVAAMTEGGYAGNPRYLAAPLGLLIAVSLAGPSWIVLRSRGRRPQLLEIGLLGLLVAIVLSGAVRLPSRTAELTHQAENRKELGALLDRPGVRDAVLACGPVWTHPLVIPPVAWTLGVHLDELGFRPDEPRGTWIFGRNVPTSPVEPPVPGVPLREVARGAQIDIRQRCIR